MFQNVVICEWYFLVLAMIEASHCKLSGLAFELVKLNEFINDLLSTDLGQKTVVVFLDCFVEVIVRGYEKDHTRLLDIS